jgi:hypothetical protein
VWLIGRRPGYWPDVGWWERRAESQQQKLQRANDRLGGADWANHVDEGLTRTRSGRAVSTYLAFRTMLLCIVVLVLAVIGLIAFIRAGT